MATYVCPAGKQYALEVRRFGQRAGCEDGRGRLGAPPGGPAAAPEEAQRLATFQSPTVLCCELIDWVVAQPLPGTFAFDSYFTNAPVCNPLAQHERAYGGDLK